MKKYTKRFVLSSIACGLILSCAFDAQAMKRFAPFAPGDDQESNQPTKKQKVNDDQQPVQEQTVQNQPTQSQPTQVQSLEKLPLPNNFIDIIFTYIPGKNLLAAALVCKQFNTAAHTALQTRHEARISFGSMLKILIDCHENKQNAQSAIDQQWETLTPKNQATITRLVHSGEIVKAAPQKKIFDWNLNQKLEQLPLPQEIFFVIFTNLDVYDLASAACVCKQFNPQAQYLLKARFSQLPNFFNSFFARQFKKYLKSLHESPLAHQAPNLPYDINENEVMSDIAEYFMSKESHQINELCQTIDTELEAAANNMITLVPKEEAKMKGSFGPIMIRLQLSQGFLTALMYMGKKELVKIAYSFFGNTPHTHNVRFMILKKMAELFHKIAQCQTNQELAVYVNTMNNYTNPFLLSPLFCRLAFRRLAISDPHITFTDTDI